MPEKLYFELPTEKGDMEIPENSPLNYEVETDFYKGNTNNAVIIIVGKGGTTQGYQDKYVTIANNLVTNHGVNVFVVENPGISRDDPELLINPVVRVDFEKLKKSLNSFKNKVTIIQGKRDTDYPFNPLLSQIPRAKVIILDGVDHQFSNEGGLDLFISLPENYLSFS